MWDVVISVVFFEISFLVVVVDVCRRVGKSYVCNLVASSPKTTVVLVSSTLWEWSFVGDVDSAPVVLARPQSTMV